MKPSFRFTVFSLLMAFVLVFSLAAPTVAFADDGTPQEPTPTVEPSEPAADEAAAEAATEEAATEEAATEEVASEEAATEEAVTEEAVAVEETLAEIVVALDEAEAVLVDAEGAPLALASEEAAELLANPDPWYVDGGVTHRFLADCTGQPVDALNTCTVSSTPIQAAINAAPAGAEIHVEAGVFNEQLVIDKSVSLVGSTGAVIKAPSVLVNDADGTKSIIVVTGATTSASISGFTIQGPGPTACGSLHFGIYVRAGAYANIFDNTIEAVGDTGNSGCQNGVAIQVGRQSAGQTGTADISNNVIEDYQKNGITVDNAGSSANITDNTITGDGPVTYIAQNGIQISRGATGTIEGNTVTGNDYTPGTWASTGILLYQAGDGVIVSGNTVEGNQINVYVQETDDVQLLNNLISNSTQFDNIDLYFADGVTISGNTISNAYYDGIWIGDSANLSITGNTFTGNGLDTGGTAAAVHLAGNDLSAIFVNNNDFTGNQTGVTNDDVAFADATNNYWGCTLGAGGAGCDTVSGNVNTAPFLVLSAFAVDTDGDLVVDASDNCPLVSNGDQADKDGDGLGNVCDRFPADPTNEGPGAPAVTTTTITGGAGGFIPVTGGQTLTLDLDAAALQAVLEELTSDQFPLEAVDGQYSFACVLESVTTLTEDTYITMGDQVVTSVGQCSYLVNGEVQTLTIALSFLGATQTFAPGSVMSVGLLADDAAASFAGSGNPFDANNFLVANTLGSTGNVGN